MKIECLLRVERGKVRARLYAITAESGERCYIVARNLGAAEILNVTEGTGHFRALSALGALAFSLSCSLERSERADVSPDLVYSLSNYERC